MDRSEFDDFKEELREIVNALKFITDIFESKLLEDYSVMIQNNCENEYNELLSINFILTQLVECLIILRRKYADC